MLLISSFISNVTQNQFGFSSPYENVHVEFSQAIAYESIRLTSRSLPAPQMCFRPVPTVLIC